MAYITESARLRKKTVKHDKQWKPGQSGNPKGRPSTGYQDFKTRLVHWLETMSYRDIQDLVDNEKRWGKLVAIDAMVVRRIHDACQKDKTGDFVAVLDRLLGKPAITGDLQVTHALADRLDQAEKLLAHNSSPMIEGTAIILNAAIEESLEPMPVAQGDDFSDLV